MGDAEKKPTFVRMMSSQTQKSKLKRARVYEGSSLGFFAADNKFRVAIISIVDSKLFERVLFFIIFLNAAFLGAEAAYPSDKMSQVQFDADIGFIVLFTIEVFMKLIAYGIWWSGPYSYFRDPWNWLDFIVTFTGYLRFFPALYEVQAINRLRLLRPLRAVTAIRRLRVLVQSMLNSLPMLLDVFLLFMFVLFVYGLIGLQFYQGRFHYRCVVPGDMTVPQGDYLSMRNNPLCSPDKRFGNQCVLPQVCSKFVGAIVGGDEIPNPEYFVGFDHIFIAFITIGQIISLEGWSSVMYHAEDTTSKIHDLFFISLVMIGSFFLVNLIVAVILIRFRQVKDIEEHKLGGAKQTATQEGVNQLSRLRSQGPIGAYSSLRNIPPETVAKNDPVFITFHGKVFYRNQLTNFNLLCLKAKAIFEHPKFQPLCLCVIVINGILLATPYQGVSQSYINALYYLNIVFNSLYTVEMVIMLLATGKPVFSQVLRMVDLIVVIANWIFIIAGLGTSWDMLLSIRLFDLLRLLSGVRALQRLVRAIEATIKDILCLTIILFLYVYVGALLGVSALRHDEGEVWDAFSERPNYDTLWMAMLSTFNMLTRENWNSLLQQYSNRPVAASAYFPIMLTIGNYLFMSLFLAMLIGNMKTQEGEESDGWWNAWPAWWPKWCCIGNADLTQTRAHREDRDTVLVEMAAVNSDPDEKKTVMYNERQKTLQDLITPRKINKVNKAAKKREKLMQFYLMDELGHESQSPIRRIAARIHVSYAFDIYALAIMAITCGFLVWDAPKETNESIAVYFDGFLFLASFIEMVIKMAARGLFKGKQAYFREFMNIIDFIVLCSFLLLLLGHLIGFYAALKAFRAIRALRPVRLIQRFESMRVIARSIGRALPEMFNVFVVGVLFYVIAGIIGLHIFRGKWGRCSHEDPRMPVNMTIFNYNLQECNTLASMGVTGYSWTNQMGPAHFDHFGAAFLTAFEVGCVENWPAYLLIGLDSTPYGERHTTNALPFAGLYFVLVLILGAFFITSLFIGVVADEYSRNYDVITGAVGLTVAQRQWLETRKLIINRPPKRLRRPTSGCSPRELKFRRKVFEFVTHTYYPYLVLALTMVNMVALACWHTTQSKGFETALNVIHYTCVALFLVECIVHSYGLGLRQYFGQRWCIFDAVTTFGAVIAFIIEVALAGVVDTGVQIKLLKMFLVFKIARFLQNSHRLRRMISTLLFCLPAILNICLLTLLTLFVYAVAGMNLFGLVKHGMYIDDHANFERFDRAIVTLVRSFTGESWQGLMHDVMNTRFCNAVDCGSPALGLIYFVSFHLIIDYLLINLFVAAVLKHFENELFKDPPEQISEQGIQSATGVGNLVGEQCLEQFVDSWLKFCNEEDDSLMSIRSFDAFLMDLPPPMGVHCKLSFILDLVNVDAIVRDDFIDAVASAGQVEAKLVAYSTSVIQNSNVLVRTMVELSPEQKPESVIASLQKMFGTRSPELTKFCDVCSVGGQSLKQDGVHFVEQPFAVSEKTGEARVTTIAKSGHKGVQFTLVIEDQKMFDEARYIQAIALGLGVDAICIHVLNSTRVNTSRVLVDVGPISKDACRKLKANILRYARDDIASALGIEPSYVLFSPAPMKVSPGKDLKEFMTHVPMSLVDDSHVHCFEAASALAFRIMSESHQKGIFNALVSVSTLFQQPAKDFEEEVRLIDRKNEMNKLINAQVQIKYPKLVKSKMAAPVMLVIYTVRIQRFWRKKRAQRLALQGLTPVEQKVAASGPARLLHSASTKIKKTMSFKMSTTQLQDLNRDSTSGPNRNILGKGNSTLALMPSTPKGSPRGSPRSTPRGSLTSTSSTSSSASPASASPTVNGFTSFPSATNSQVPTRGSVEVGAMPLIKVTPATPLNTSIVQSSTSSTTLINETNHLPETEVEQTFTTETATQSSPMLETSVDPILISERPPSSPSLTVLVLSEQPTPSTSPATSTKPIPAAVSTDTPPSTSSFEFVESPLPTPSSGGAEADFP